MSIWQLCANLLIPNSLRSNLSYSPLAALELYVKWDKTTELSSLTANLYSSKQLTIIQNLIKSDEWIEEEGNDIGEIINGIKSGII